jgi:hypothetical protein
MVVVSFMATQKCEARDGACKSTAILPPEQSAKYFVHTSSIFTSAHEKGVLLTWRHYNLHLDLHCAALLTNPTPHSTQPYFRPARTKDKVSFWSGLAWGLFIVAGHPPHTPYPIRHDTTRHDLSRIFNVKQKSRKVAKAHKTSSILG